MPNRLWGTVILVGWVIWQTAAVRGDEGYFPRREETPFARQAGWQEMGRPQPDVYRPPTDRGWVANIAQQPRGVPQPPQGQWSPAPPVYDPRPGAGPAGRELAGSWQVPKPLPPTGPRVYGGPMPAGPGPAPRMPAQPTFRQDNRPFPEAPRNQPGEFGRAGLVPMEPGRSVWGEPGGGALRGRLLNKGRPLVNCRVVIVPMHQEKGVYCYDRDRNMLSTTTGEDGVYYFENAAPGEYKLTWLPAGQTRWIRRIAMRPDIKVRNGQTTTAKEIRVALTTIN